MSTVEKMRMSRMSMGAGGFEQNGERISGVEFGGPKSGGRVVGKFKQAPNIKQDAYQQYQGTSGLFNSESEISLGRKNLKSNVHLQPLNYKTSANPPPQVTQSGIEEILKNHQMPYSQKGDPPYGAGPLPLKKVQL